MFTALELPERFADDASALARRLEAVVEGRFVPREARHLTLAFLGDVTEADALAAADALEAACAGVPHIPLRAAGLGTHSDLLRSCESYREIAQVQMGEVE